MPVRINHHVADKYVELHVSGKLEKSDYDRFVPAFEQLMKDHGRLRLLVVLENFDGWTASALWEDVKFDARHFSDFVRIAVVGEKKWHSGMTTFCKPFTSAAVRYFEKFEVDDARAWLMKEASQVPAPSTR